MDKLYKKLYDIYIKELLNLNIGYEFNKCNITSMMNLINAIYYINSNDLTELEKHNLIHYYE